MARQVKAQPAAVPVPQSREEAAAFIAEIGEEQRWRVILEEEMNRDLLRIKAEYERGARVHADRISALAHGLQIWAAANRAGLTRDGKTKTARLATGELRWRMTPPAVALRGMKAVLAALKAAGFDRFIRVKEEVDKEAMLKEPEIAAGIAGVTIGQREELVIVPFATKLEEVAP